LYLCGAISTDEAKYCRTCGGGPIGPKFGGPTTPMADESLIKKSNDQVSTRPRKASAIFRLLSFIAVILTLLTAIITFWNQVVSRQAKEKSAEIVQPNNITINSSSDSKDNAGNPQPGIRSQANPQQPKAVEAAKPDSGRQNSPNPKPGAEATTNSRDIRKVLIAVTETIEGQSISDGPIARMLTQKLVENNFSVASGTSQGHAQYGILV